jgi:hypothetical protein
MRQHRNKGEPMKKHGGMYFWKIGPFGGSFYVRAAARHRLALAANVAFASLFGVAIGALIGFSL